MEHLKSVHWYIDLDRYVMYKRYASIKAQKVNFHNIVLNHWLGALIYIWSLRLYTSGTTTKLILNLDALIDTHTKIRARACYTYAREYIYLSPLPHLLLFVL